MKREIRKRRCIFRPQVAIDNWPKWGAEEADGGRIFTRAAIWSFTTPPPSHANWPAPGLWGHRTLGIEIGTLDSALWKASPFLYQQSFIKLNYNLPLYSIIFLLYNLSCRQAAGVKYLLKPSCAQNLQKFLWKVLHRTFPASIKDLYLALIKSCSVIFQLLIFHWK